MNLPRLIEVVTRKVVSALLADEVFLERMSDKLRVVKEPTPKEPPWISSPG
jgi:hypothetical protein